MKREEIAGRAMFDFYKHFYIGDLEEHEKEIIQFIHENKKLSDDKFFKKFEEQFNTGYLEEYERGIIQFIRENKELSDNEFFKKFDEQFAMINVLHKTYSRIYLEKIASGVTTIKVIAIIYLIASIIGAIFIIIK